MADNSVGGSYTTTPQRTMNAYDGLPANVRLALQNSIEDWVPQPLVTAFEKRGVHRNELARMVKRWDREELAKREQQRCRATGPYKGLLPDPSYQPKKRRKRRKV